MTGLITSRGFVGRKSVVMLKRGDLAWGVSELLIWPFWVSGCGDSNPREGRRGIELFRAFSEEKVDLAVELIVA